MKDFDTTFRFWYVRREDTLNNALNFLLANLHTFVICSLKLRCSSLVTSSSYLVAVSKFMIGKYFILIGFSFQAHEFTFTRIKDHTILTEPVL